MQGNNVLAVNAEVAIVDDDESIREAIKTLLESMRLRVEDFSSADTFLNSARVENFDCLLLDVRMPGLNGLELQRRLIADNSRVPIVFITAHFREEDRAKAMAAGAVAFLSKPFSESELLTAIRSAFASRKNASARYAEETDGAEEQRGM